MGRRHRLLLVLAVTSALAIVVGGAMSSAPVLGAADGAGPNMSTLDEPALVYDIEVTPTGDAMWQISARFPIDTPERASAFARLAAEYETDGGEEYLPLEPYEEVVTRADDAIDRPMTMTDVDRRVVRSDDVGRIVVTFRWHGFAATDDDRVAVGDVFEVTERGWFWDLEANEHVRVHPPANYTVEQAAGPVYNRTVWITGPADLRTAGLTVTFVSPSAFNGNGGTVPPADGSGGNGGIAMPFLVAGVAVLTVLVAIAIVLVDRRPDEVLAEALAPITGALVGRWRSPENGPTDASTGKSDPGAPPDPELLSDEERVIRLVEENDGRMKQGEIVNATDWSHAKVSQLLSQLAEEGRLEKLRIGRENLIKLADDENPAPD